MTVFPIAAALVSAIFAIQLLTSWSRRKRFPQLAWGIAMTMFTIASLAVAGGVGGGWDPTLFRVYWLFGALINVPYLALGSVALLGRRGLTLLMLVLVLAATLVAVVAVVASSVDIPPSVGNEIPRGSAAWGKGTLVAKLATYLSIPAYVIVVLIAVASSRGGRLPPYRVRGNWLIAIGATIVAAGGTFARYGRGAVFSICLAVGVIVIFLGFRLASRSPRAPALVLYTSERCGLCDRAKEALAAVGVAYEEVLVPDDHPYRLRTPVLESGGRVVAEGDITAGVLRRRIRSG